MTKEPTANVFVATAEEAATGASFAVADGVTGHTLYGICVESIAALHHVLIGQAYDPCDVNLDILRSHAQVFVYDDMHGGWLFRFPAEVVEMLAAINEADRHELAVKWSEVFANNGRPPTIDEVEVALTRLIGLARNAIRQQEQLYWLQESC
jgi:hypothetical protein